MLLLLLLASNGLGKVKRQNKLGLFTKWRTVGFPRMDLSRRRRCRQR